MATEGNRGILNAYEKMFKDGSAYKKVKISQPTPENPNGSSYGNGSGRLGDPLKVAEGNKEDEDDRFVRQMDDYREKRLQELKETGGKKQEPNNLVNEVKKLKQRVKLLEQALSMVMETQTKLIKGS